MRKKTRSPGASCASGTALRGALLRGRGARDADADALVDEERKSAAVEALAVRAAELVGSADERGGNVCDRSAGLGRRGSARAGAAGRAGREVTRLQLLSRSVLSRSAARRRGRLTARTVQANARARAPSVAAARGRAQRSGARAPRCRRRYSAARRGVRSASHRASPRRRCDAEMPR